MKILVCISHVPDTTSKINFTDENTVFDSQGVQYVINPNDEFGLTRAMWFKEKQSAIIEVINVGGVSTEPTLRKALAIGADKAIRIDSEPIDGLFVAKEIAEHIKSNNYDLIIAGRESIDYNGGMVPGLIAGLLQINFITNCTKLDIENNTATIEREIDGGKEILSCSLPLIIGGQKGLVEESDLRIPNMRGIMQARQKPLEVIPPSNSNSKTKSIKFYKPEPRKEVKLISSDNLDQLIDLLHNEAKVL
ncbi:MAG: electron transfer flavoprotein subunit beta/FixA family protein [Bacteroidetes bacterium]|jgi:electron transfer flavoprotein beta subunit|nr:MAG: electron transfer flavoprotein subunit alpha [Cryomorphaceae bacterium BACL29 MAG-121220-bin8]MDA0758468.1 electron transfer flavoprotein subunit beta/FixA family protein [Bacteroidota bacterium]MDA1018742.1 electron transfer flavoprotein subunit beta/FixA family protein [Bacteroidota bacterium]